MADSTVSALPAASALSGTELFYGVQSGGDVKVTGAQLQTLCGASGGTYTAAVGALGTPSYTFTGYTARGLWVDATNLYVNYDANYGFSFAATGNFFSTFNGGTRGSLNMASGNGNDCAFSTNSNNANFTLTTTAISKLSSPAANNFQFGGFDEAAPAAQTISTQNVYATTAATAGVSLTLIGSLGTDTAAGGNVIEKTGFSAKSGSSGVQHTAVDRKIIVAKGKVLTSTSLFAMFDVALPTLTMCGGVIEATIVCTNGTDMQSFTQTVTYSAVNKGGVYTTSLTASTGDKSVSTGTLTTSWTIVSGANKVTINVTPTTSLTPSSNSFLLYYTVKNNSEQATTIL